MRCDFSHDMIQLIFSLLGIAISIVITNGGLLLASILCTGYCFNEYIYTWSNIILLNKEHPLTQKKYVFYRKKIILPFINFINFAIFGVLFCLFPLFFHVGDKYIVAQVVYILCFFYLFRNIKYEKYYILGSLLCLISDDYFIFTTLLIMAISFAIWRAFTIFISTLDELRTESSLEIVNPEWEETLTQEITSYDSLHHLESLIVFKCEDDYICDIVVVLEEDSSIESAKIEINSILNKYGVKNKNISCYFV